MGHTVNSKDSEKEILPGARIVSLGLYFEKEKALALGDLHLGMEEELNNQGFFVPRTNFQSLMKELSRIFSATGKVNTIVLLGDIKHEFGSASAQEWREVLALTRHLKAHAKEIIALKGNHDNYLKQILAKEGVVLQESLVWGNYLFCHGDKIIKSGESGAAARKVKELIIGHEHAAITLSDEYKSEKFKCFAKTKYKNKQLIIMPSLNFLSIGTDLTTEKLLSPYLQGMKGFECWVVEEGRAFYFGKKKRND